MRENLGPQVGNGPAIAAIVAGIAAFLTSFPLNVVAAFIAFMSGGEGLRRGLAGAPHRNTAIAGMLLGVLWAVFAIVSIIVISR